MLVASLPHYPSWFAAKQTPLSRLRLEQRLRLLDERDSEQLALVEGLLRWESMTALGSDEALCKAAAESVARLDGEFLRKLVHDRLELRTLVAALRRRRLGRAAPAPGEAWGFGRWVDTICRHWHEPVFRLERFFPWAREAHRLLEAEQWLALERLLLGVVWDDLGRRAEGHYFDFEAVVIYVLRWSVIARWTAYEAARASERFARLADESLGECELALES